MPSALFFSFSPASPQHKEASAEERGVQFVDEKVELAPVVQKLDSAIYRINHCVHWISIRETDCTIHWIEIYAVDSAIHLLNNWGLEGKLSVFYRRYVDDTLTVMPDTK